MFFRLINFFFTSHLYYHSPKWLLGSSQSAPDKSRGFPTCCFGSNEKVDIAIQDMQ